MRFDRRWLRLLGLVAGLSCLPALANTSCGSAATPISAIQGSGDSSPLIGQTLTLEGVITLDSRHPDGFGGFYVQQPDDAVDSSDQTSEAVFVYTRRSGGREGDTVRLTGRVKEYHGLTEITSLSALHVCGAGKLPDPIPISLPWSAPHWPESLENMRITLRNPLTLIDPYTFTRYGELVLADELQLTPTQVMSPGPDTQPLKAAQLRQRLILDDGRGSRNPESLPWPADLISAGQSVRVGDRVHQLEGILDFRFGHWRLQPTRTPSLQPRNPRPEPPKRTSTSDIRVVSLNLDNLFNGEGRGDGFPSGRGAESAIEYQRQRHRLVQAVQALNPDILMVAEIENDDYSDASALADLTNALGKPWRFIATPGNTGQDAIRTDLIYRSDRVSPQGPALRLQQGAYLGQGRPPIAQVFRIKSAEEQNAHTFRVVAVHLKSKSCRGAEGLNRDQEDGQGCYNHRRTEEIRAIARWLSRLPQPEGLLGTLVGGDLNSYAREQPIQTLQTAGYINLLEMDDNCRALGCPQATYLFQGRLGTLDYSFASESLRNRVRNAGAWGINAQEFPALGYQGRLSDQDPGPWRASDHNPVFTDLAF